MQVIEIPAKPPCSPPIAKCSTCGLCCQRMPGAASPCDFGRDAESVKLAVLEALATDMWSIDWWEGDPREGKNYGDEDFMGRAYFVRPATLARFEDEGHSVMAGDQHFCSSPRFDASWGGPCVMLTPTGCRLTPEQRPSECATLVAKDDGECTAESCQGYHKHGAALAWIPFTEFFNKIPKKGSLQPMIDE